MPRLAGMLTVSPADSVEVCSALIPEGPFILPEGYKLGSIVVYLYYDGRRLTKPVTLSLPYLYASWQTDNSLTLTQHWAMLVE